MRESIMDDDRLDNAQGALEDILGAFSRQKKPLPGYRIRWFLPMGDFLAEVPNDLAEALERGRKGVDDLADHRRPLP